MLVVISVWLINNETAVVVDSETLRESPTSAVSEKRTTLPVNNKLLPNEEDDDDNNAGYDRKL